MAAALVLLIGASIAFASSSLQQGHGTGRPTPTPLAQVSAPTGVPTPAPTNDRQPPDISVTQPPAGATIYAETVTLLGNTEPGATVSVSDQAAGDDFQVATDANGSFDTTLPLSLGSNWFMLKSEDEASNVAGNASRSCGQPVAAPSTWC